MPGPGGAVAADLIGLGHVNLLPLPLLPPLSEQQEPKRKEANEKQQHAYGKYGQESEDLQLLVALSLTSSIRNDEVDPTEEISLSSQSWSSLEHQPVFQLLRVASKLPSQTSSIYPTTVPVEIEPASAIYFVGNVAVAQPRRTICYN
jgi:hypothetical protein